METTVDIGLGREALRLYLNEVKDSPIEVEFEEEEHLLLDEVEQATDFLQKAGLSNLSKVYHEGQEITESMVNDSVRHRNLTEKQAQTVRSRIKTLNKTLRNRQPRRKQRQDVREVAWGVETSSTGTRSRSATPDSLDSTEAINDDELTSDEDQQHPMSHHPTDADRVVPLKGKLKLTSSEPLSHSKFSRNEFKGDIAHLGSENVILKGYHPLGEYGSLGWRERSGSDPTTEVLTSLENHSPGSFIKATNLSSTLSRSHNSLLAASNEPVIVSNEAMSFQELLKQNSMLLSNTVGAEISVTEAILVDDLTDSQYQHLKPLLWVEVTTIFDQYNFSVLKRKSSSKSKRGNVFGVHLSTLVMRDMPRPTDNFMIPQIFQTIIHQLNVRCLKDDGILRIAGQQHRLNYLCSEIEAKFYNNRKHIENLIAKATGHELTGILKKLLRDLPDTIFTMELFDMFHKCSMIPNYEDRKSALNLLVLLMPVEHRNTFRLLLQFCLNVIEHKDQNRMTLNNVATITAPTFFHQKLPKDFNKVDPKLKREEQLKHLHDMAIYCCVMEHLLKCGEALWFVPLDLAEQAKDAQKKAQDRKDPGKERRFQYGKKKLHRSSTQYESGSMANPRMKKNELFI